MAFQRFARKFATICTTIRMIFGASTSRAIPDELVVHTDEIRAPGSWGIEWSARYAISAAKYRADPSAKSTYHLWQISPELTYGLSSTNQVGLQLFTSSSAASVGNIDGGRFSFMHLPIRPENEEADGLFLGGMVELGRLPRTISTNNLDAELRGIMGIRSGKWTLATNPEIGFSVSGSGDSTPELSLRTKLAYQASGSRAYSIEYYADLGSFKSIGSLSQRSQQIFGVVDWKNREWDLSIGIGRGLNNYSDPWMLKAMIGFPIGK